MVFRLTGDDTQIYLTKDTCDCFENSQSRPHRRSRALLSRDWVRELPQPAFRHRHLIRPELVLPFRFIGSPHTAQQGVFIHPICHANSKVTQPLCRKA